MPFEGHGEESTQKVVHKLGNAAMWQQVVLPTLTAAALGAARPVGVATCTMYGEFRKVERMNY